MTDSGRGMDVSIGGQEFRLAISKDNPYERATAQFRKDQVDQSATVGDQSLTGWWTRGQLSFHKGAGIKYYEVLDGNTVLNRFRDSTGIDPWTPGELSLSPSNTTVALASVEDAVGATVSGSPGVMALVSGSLRFAAAAAGATFPSWNYRNFLSVTTSGSSSYACTAGDIETLPASPAATTTNVVKNPRAYTTGNPWGFNTNAQAFGLHDGYAEFFANATDSTAEFYPPLASSPFVVGKTYRVIIEQRSAVHQVAVTLDGTVIGSGNSSHVEVSFTATSTSHSIRAYPLSLASTYQIHEFSITDDPYSRNPNPLDDSRWTWSGTAHNSTPHRVSTTSDMSPLWYPPSGRAWTKIWWAKGRIFALDDLGQWYTLSTVGGTASSSDVFWNPNLGTTGWSLAESPGAVYISQGTNIYAITPDASGTVPVITTPVVAASFPTGEEISCIYAYLGRLIACTNLGLRVAFVQSDGSLAYGQHAVEGDFSGTVRISALRDLAYVVGTREGDATPSLFTVNMLNDVSDLLPVWAELAPMNSGTLLGATVTPDGRVMAWDGAGFYRTGTGLQSTGFVETGFHRLGTLEPKSFQFCRVKVDGTGTVAVAAILTDGTTASVGTVTAPASEDLSLSTAVPSPQEYIGLKFTLNGDGATSPVLLGYQLKALPAPARQRMIRLPLMCKDIERRGGAPAQGYAGSAWDRLKALEDMEAAGATFDFTDYRTGETGKVFVESVEYRGETPPGDQSNGVGGIIWATLRKI